ncbi:uncharacterized protein LOC132991399 [Labrus mixtus]|uniref:uncharacterized protein LOC132991399 n=1 Tax=Labrus mixtus TaxID=508554 RepID=UPI0029C0DF63|nr:uncharacterized protein LOC132991399 [Labrus mixtus]
MASGFGLRVLLLSLLAVGQHANELSYRSGGSKTVTPYFEQAESFQRRPKPYEPSAQQGSSLSSYGQSYTDSGSSGNRKPAAAPYSGSYGSGVDGYSPERSVSTHKPPIIRQNPQQPTQGVYQSKDNMWDIALQQNENVVETAVASSRGIEIYLGSQPEAGRANGYPSKPQQPGYQSKPQQPGYQSKPQQPQQPGYQSKPQQPGYQSKPQQPGYQSKPQSKPQQPSYQSKPPSKPQQPSYLKPQQLSYQSKPQEPQFQPRQPKPQQGVQQSKDVMWDLDFYPESGSPRRSRPIPIASRDYPGWKQPLVPVFNRNHRL